MKEKKKRKKNWCSENEKENTQKAAEKWEDKEKKKQQQQLANEEEMNHFVSCESCIERDWEAITGLEVNACAWCERVNGIDVSAIALPKYHRNQFSMNWRCGVGVSVEVDFFSVFSSFHAYWTVVYFTLELKQWP